MRIFQYTVAFCLLLALSAHALTSTSFVPISTGVFDDSSLSGFTTYSYRVDAATDWTNSDLGVYLTSGTINHIEPPLFRSPHGALGFGDSAGFASSKVLGDLTGGFNGVALAAGDHIETPTQLTTSWFTTETTDVGIFDIAMITLSNDANGTLEYRTLSGSDIEDGPDGGDVLFADLNIVNGQIIPFDGPLLPSVRPPSQPPTSPPGPADRRATTFVPVHTGKFDDASLSGFTTYAYRVDAPTDWTNSDMQVLLTSGTLNHLQPELFGSETAVNGLGDSTVFAPTLVLGDLTGGFQGQVGVFDHLETPTELTTSWFTSDSDNLGTFDIAMITLSDDANGTLAYRTRYGNLVDHGPAAGSRFALLPDFNIVNGQIVAIDRPEPPTLPEPPVIPEPPTLPDPPTNPPVDPPTGPTNGQNAATTTFVPVVTGTFDDPNLEGFTTYAYRVDAPTDWTNAELQVLLTSGTLNHIPPEMFGSENRVNGFGDSAGIAPTVVLGDLSAGSQGTVQFAGTHVETPTELTTLWFTTDTDNIGTFDIAMITLSDDANGTLAYTTISGSAVDFGPGGQATIFNSFPDFSIVNGQIVPLLGTDPSGPPTLPDPPTGSDATADANSSQDGQLPVLPF